MPANPPNPPRAVKELREIPFGFLIGQPLKAAIEAQALAAKTTIEFIETVGFIPTDNQQGMLFKDTAVDADAGEVRNVTFRYSKRDENGVRAEHTLSVPILSIVPIPVLRIDEVTIDFTAKLTDTIESTEKNDFSLQAEANGKFKSFWSPVSLEFRTSLKYDQSNASSARYSRDYTMSIHVRAVQDDMPAGLSRILDILESSIKEEKTANP